MSVEALANRAGKLFRSARDERRYGARRRVVSLRYASYEDYIKTKHLGFGRSENGDGKIEAVAREGVRAIYFAKNQFPYEGLGEGVSHWVLFSLVPLTKRQVDALLSVYLPEGTPRSHYVNPPALRSVPGIWHAQVFFKRA